MTFRIVSTGLFLALSMPLSAQDYAAHSTSSITQTDRYEIVQSEISAEWTFRLDRFCGNVFQLVATTAGEDTWQTMDIESLPKCQTDGRTHYQLFASGLAAKHTFLMNTATGTTWILVHDKNDISSWQLFSR